MYWRCVEEIYHVQNGLHNWASFYNSQIQRLEETSEVIKKHFAPSPHLGAPLLRAIQVANEAYMNQAAAAEGVLRDHASHINSSFVLPVHVAEVADAVAQGLLRNQHNI